MTSPADRTFRITLGGLLCCLVVAGCGRGDRLRPPEVPYAARVSATSEDRRDITVAVSVPGASLEQVRESARYGVTRYCLTRFGASDADWMRDPAGGDWALAATDGGVLLQARCTAR